MSKLEFESYKQMTPAAVQQWLVGSSIVASIVGAGLIVIATNNFGRGLNTDSPAPADPIQQVSAIPRVQ